MKTGLKFLEGSTHYIEGTLYGRKPVNQWSLIKLLPVTLFGILFRTNFSLLPEGRNAVEGIVN